jgi:HSP20 family protein
MSITGDILTLKVVFKEQEEKKEKAYHLCEQRFGSFERTIDLPTEVVAGKARADFEDGVLTITLLKPEEVRPRSITVKAK